MKLSTAFPWFLRLPGNNHGKPIGYLTGQNSPKSEVFCQENLTEFARKVENRTEITPYIMKLGENGSRMAALAAVVAAGMSGAPERAEAGEQIILATAGQTVRSVEDCKEARRAGELDRAGYRECKRVAQDATIEANKDIIAEQQRVLAALQERLAAYGLQLNSKAQILDEGGQVLAQIVAINGRLVMAEERIRAADARSAAAIESAKAFLEANS